MSSEYDLGKNMDITAMNINLEEVLSITRKSSRNNKLKEGKLL